MLLSPMQTLRRVRWLVRLQLAALVTTLGAGGGRHVHRCGGGVADAPSAGAGTDLLRRGRHRTAIAPRWRRRAAVRPPARLPPLPPRGPPAARAAGRPAPAPPLGTGPARPRCHAYRCAHFRATAAARAPGRPLISCILI